MGRRVRNSYKRVWLHQNTPTESVHLLNLMEASTLYERSQKARVGFWLLLMSILKVNNQNSSIWNKRSLSRCLSRVVDGSSQYNFQVVLKETTLNLNPTFIKGIVRTG